MATYCLECGDSGTVCPITGTTACGIPQVSGSATIENGASCTQWPLSGDPFVGVSFMRGASAQCRYLVDNPDGGESLGEIWKLMGGDYLAYFPGFGGWCTGRSAFSGAPRGVVTCPLCSFTLLGFE
jgi:hypothetical protein